MIQKITTVLAAIMLAIALGAHLLGASHQVSAQSVDSSKNAVCEGIGAGTNCKSAKATTDKKVSETLSLVINILSLIGGAVAVIMIIVGGLRYIISNGDATATGNAKNTILYAVIGLVVIALSQVIVRFVIARSTSL